MQGDFQGQTAIITGGGTGLGKDIAMELSARGANVVIASRTMEHLEPTAEWIRARTGGKVLPVQTDVRDPEQVQAMIDRTWSEFGAIDVLVNNAAGNFVVPAEKLSANGWNTVINIVLNGTWYCSSAAGKKMIEQGHGCILNIIATFAWTGAPGVVHSASAKAGVMAMTRTLAGEWGQHNIRVNALAPGVMVTEGASKNLLYDNPEAQKKILSGIPLRRFASTEEIARICGFLCSKDAAYISGDVITADGARWLGDGFTDLMGATANSR